MFQRILIPVDGSAHSLTAVQFGASIAAECDADLELVHVSPTMLQRADAQTDLEHGLATLDPLAVEPKISHLVDGSVTSAIAEHSEALEGTMIVMASTGHGRSAAVLGSTAEELLNRTFGPLVVIGPRATEPKPLAGTILVPVDGSKFSESSLNLAGAWGIGFGGTPWVVHVLTTDVQVSNDYIESSYVARVARDLQATTHHDVEYEILHGSSPANAIVDYASTTDARLIIMSTHGRTGVQRLRLGSVAAGVVHNAECPVVLHRPPHLAR